MVAIVSGPTVPRRAVSVADETRSRGRHERATHRDEALSYVGRHRCLGLGQLLLLAVPRSRPRVEFDEP